jgi:PAS domain S-box-containing protein
MVSVMRTTPSSQASIGLVGAAVFTALLFASFAAERAFGRGFLPHGYCFTWIPGLLWLNVISDVLIAVAYLSIPLSLAYFVRRRVDLPFSWVFVLFGVFIVACGATHALHVWTVWNANYWLLGGVKAITAAASVPTAAVLIWMIPKALAIPSARELREANDALSREVAARALVEQRLEESKAELHKLVQEKSTALHTTSALLDAFFDSSPLALAVFDSQRRFVKVNPTFAAVTGLPVEHHWGRTFSEADDKVDPLVVAAVKEVREGNARVRQLEVTRAQGAVTSTWRVTIHAIPGTGANPLTGYSAQCLT